MRIDARGQQPEDVDLEPVLAHLGADGVLGHPTSTVYGLGGRHSAAALNAVRHAKGLAEDRPLILLVSGPDAVADLDWTPEARALADVFWPGALTLLLGDPHGRWDGVTSGSGAVAVRRSGHPLTDRLVQQLGEPMTSTSANAPGAAPARDADGVLRLLGDRAAMVLDVGTLPPSAASTIVDCRTTPPRLVRAGAVPITRLRCLVPVLDDPET